MPSFSILIVEDNAGIRENLVAGLSDYHHTFSAPDGEAGYRLAADKIPDLIISGISERCGIDLCKRIKTGASTFHIPVILLTAKARMKKQIEMIETMEMGADAYVVKPFSIELLRVQINQLIASRRELYARFSQNVCFRQPGSAISEPDRLFLQKVSDYIIQNMTDQTLSVDKLSKFLHRSRSVTYRKVKSLTGKSVVEYIKWIRLKEALKLMESKRFSLSEIAYRTGFTSPAYFTKSFREQYGKPPSGFLKNKM